MAYTLFPRLAVIAAGLLTVLHAQSFHQSYAIVIGIHVYASADIPSLVNSRKDAEAIATLLKRQGYLVSEFYDGDATRGAILDAMDVIAQRATENDRVLFFFSGHGTTLPRANKDWGYIIPYDGRPQQSSTLIGMDQLQTESAQLGNARHQLFLMDSCYGGSIGDRGITGVSRTIPNYVSEISRRAAREALTAGGKDQTVEDGANGHSIFTQALLEAIDQGKADLDGDGVITFPELTAYVLRRATTGRQTPLQTRLPGHGQGEYWFEAPRLQQPDVARSAPEAPALVRSGEPAITIPAPPANRAAESDYRPEPMTVNPPATSLPTFKLSAKTGFKPFSTHSRGLLSKPILDIGNSTIEAQANNGAISLTYDGEIVGNLSCRGLSVDSSGASAVDTTDFPIAGTDHVSIKSASGSFSYYSNKLSSDDRKQIRQGLGELCLK